MQGLLSFDSVLSILSNLQVGYYQLSNVAGTEVFARSHDNESAADLDPSALLGEVQDRVMNFGPGTYKLIVKKTYKSNNPYTYRFYVPKDGQGTPAQTAGLGGAPAGFDFAQLSGMHQQQLATVLGYERQLAEMRESIADLKREQQIKDLKEELKREKRKEKGAGGLSGTLEKALTGVLVVAVSERYPKSLPALLAALKSANGEDPDGEDEEDEDNKPTPFTRED